MSLKELAFIEGMSELMRIYINSDFKPVQLRSIYPIVIIIFDKNFFIKEMHITENHYNLIQDLL